MKSVKFYLCVALLASCIMWSTDDISGLVSSGESEPLCTINQPTVNYCISVYDSKPVLRVLAEVISSSPLMFSLSYKHGAPPVVMDASCVDHNCTSLFLIDWECDKVNNNSTINVTISVEGCSNSTVKMTSELWNNQIVDITLGEVMDTAATIVCKLSCFTEEIGCIPVDTNLTFHTSNITGDPNSYSYRSQKVTVTNLVSGKAYNVCVSAYNLTTTELQGIVLCEVFTTHHHHKGVSVAVVAVIATIVTILAGVAIVLYLIYYHHKLRFRYKKNRSLRWFDQTHEVNPGDDIALPLAEVPHDQLPVNVQQQAAEVALRDDNVLPIAKVHNQLPANVQQQAAEVEHIDSRDDISQASAEQQWYDAEGPQVVASRELSPAELQWYDAELQVVAPRDSIFSGQQWFDAADVAAEDGISLVSARQHVEQQTLDNEDIPSEDDIFLFSVELLNVEQSPKNEIAMDD